MKEYSVFNYRILHGLSSSPSSSDRILCSNSQVRGLMVFLRVRSTTGVRF